MRGLKFIWSSGSHRPRPVAPRVGAWIEIGHRRLRLTAGVVAPRVGAWIEIVTRQRLVTLIIVAPRVGAWIEISDKPVDIIGFICRTPCGCVD